MAANSTEFKVRITAQLGQLRAALDDLQKRLAKVGAGGKQAGTEAATGLARVRKEAGGAATDADRMATSMRRAASAVGALGAIFAGFRAAKAFIDIADQATMLRGRLSLVTDSMEEQARAERELFNIAQRTRSSIGSTVELYTRFAQSTEELGTTQGELLRVTETVNKAIRISGTASESANLAIIQLGQGLASGTLRGEELNSVLEQAPRLAKAIAVGMGVTVGQLRKLGAEGKITAEAVLDALGSQADAIDAEFAKLPTTVGGAVTKVQNALARLIDNINRAEGATGGLADGFSALAEVLSSGSIERASIVAFGAVQFAAIKTAAFIERIVEGVKSLAEIASAPFNDDTVAAAQQRMDERRARIAAAEQQSLDALVQSRQKSLDLLEQQGDAADKNASDEERRARSRTDGKPFGDVVVDYTAAERERISQVQALRDREFADGLISARDYYEQRAQLQRDAIDLEIAQQRDAAANAKKGTERGAALSAIVALEQQREGIKAEADAKIEESERKLQAELRTIRAQTLAYEGKAFEARAVEVEAQYADLLQRLRAEGDAEGASLVERLIGYEKAKAQLQKLGEDIDAVIARFRAAEQSASNSVATGTSQRSAFDATRAAAAEALPALQRYRDELRALAPTSKEAADKLREVESAILDIEQKSRGGAALAIANLRKELAGLQTSFQSDVAFALRDNLKGLFDDIISGSKSALRAVEDFAKGFAKAVLSIITQILATKAATAILESTGLFGGVGTTVGAVKHAGGLVGAGGPSRRVSALAFAAAPRLHSGGVLGLRSDEVPTILQRGEEVLSKNNPRNVRNGGGAQGGGGNVTLQVHPDAINMTLRDWLEGELARIGARQ